MARERYMQMRITKDWLPVSDGKRHARHIYHEFSSSAIAAESLIRLSYAIHNNFTPETKGVLSDELVEKLTHRMYFNEEIGETALRLTDKGRVTANLVIADIDIDNGSFYGELREPFVGYPILDQGFEGLREIQRKREREDIRPLRASNDRLTS